MGESPPITGTSGGGVNALLGDLKLLFGALAQNGAGANVVIVAPLPQAASLKAQVGPKFDWPIYASTAMTAAAVGAIDITSFVSGFKSEVEFDVSRATALAMDTAPTDISAAPLVKSSFQVEMLALKATMFLCWTMRVAGHSQLVTGCTW
jgi:hypothetical protein